MQTKKPMIKETVGSQYYAFNTPAEGTDFDPTKYSETIQTDVVKSIGTTENSESTAIYASGKTYGTVNNTSDVELAVEVVAFPAEDLAKMRGDTVGTNGLNLSGKTVQRSYFAYGKVVKKVGGGVRFDWYPKCQLIENTDEIKTQEGTFSEQNDTVTIRAYPFDSDGNVKTYIDSEMSNFPEGMTEAKFFAKPITSDNELNTVIEGA